MPEVSDICLILEGCYPFVTGGVSQWVQMLMTNLAEFSFSIVVISPDETRREARYNFPGNVMQVVETAIEQPFFLNRPCRRCPEEEHWRGIEQYHESMVSGEFSGFGAFFDLVIGRSAPLVDIRNMLTNKRAFALIGKMNRRYGRFSALIDYFHTWRSTHFPLFHLLRTKVPAARVYHTISTGFAGFLGAVASWRNNAPLLLTEHGIYTKEREMEIMRAEWIEESQKSFWIRYFNALGALTYEAASEIISLFEVNRKLQVSLGAAEEKTRVIPNGIRTERFSVAARDENDKTFRVGLVGRITPIKDIKTFVKACALVARRYPETEFFCLGPWDEDPSYADECRHLARDLGVDRKLSFPGRVDVMEWYPRLDLLVLSSVKEAQPLVLIEAMCAGIPTVATRVGGVAEIIEGCGLVVNPKRPSDMARAITRFIEDHEFRQRCVQVGIERAQTVYSLKNVVTTYRDLYKKYIDRD